jgi:NADH-quinone oxidoreductase subunit J
MSFAVFAFYLFAIVAVASGILVVFARNPVHSVLWLITAFISSAGLFVLLGAEFVAMILLIVYVGAVAVLFLFVVMMLDVDFAELRGSMAKFLPLGLLVAAVLLVELGFAFGSWEVNDEAMALRSAIAPDPAATQNTAALGNLLYTQYVFLFEMAGLVLLVAMIGAIVLTHRRRGGVKKQDVLTQMYRDPATAVELLDIKPGQGA